MPSELVWVALIGIGGALLGAGISGLVTYKVTTRQTEAQKDQVTKQIEYQVDEARRNRIAESRKAYLDPLKLALIHWLHTFHLLVSAINSSTVGFERGVSVTEQARLTADSISATDAVSLASNELNMYVGQLADRELSALLDEAKASATAHMPELLESARASAAVLDQLERGEVHP